MPLRFCNIAFGLLFALLCTQPLAADPYKKVDSFTLSNGLKIYLAPSESAQLTTVKLVVNVGWQNETPQNIGVSHLLEHVLFRNKRLRDNMSYLQLIQENGGQANGTTTQYKTNYFASVPKIKSLWLLDSFREMIFAPSIIDEYTQNEKKTVLLEIGQPGVVADFFGFDLLKYLFPKYLRQKTFYESEFGLRFENNFSREEERLNTKRLKTRALKNHYEKHYSPNNMILYVAGGFDPQMIRQNIESKWAVIPSFDPPPPLEKQQAQIKELPYYQLRSSNERFIIALGSKFKNLNLKEEIALRAYLSHLEHRLMKTWRNEKGLVYSVNSDIDVKADYGYGGIEFSTEKETFFGLYTEAKNILRTETQDQDIDERFFNEAKDLYLKEFDLSTFSASNMLFYAESMESIQEDYGMNTSPYEVLTNLTFKEYKSALRKHFKENLWYHYLNFPPFLFKFEDLFFEILLFLLAFFFVRKKLTRPFSHSEVRLVRKLAYPPLFLVEGLALVFCFYTYLHITLLTNLAVKFVGIHLGWPFFDYYFSVLIAVTLAAVILPLVFGLLPYKVMIEGADLVFKSRSLLSLKRPLADISEVQTFKSYFLLLIQPKLLWKLKWRQFYLLPLPWKPVTVIHFSDGTAVSLLMKDNQGFAKDLQQATVASGQNYG